MGFADYFGPVLLQLCTYDLIQILEMNNFLPLNPFWLVHFLLDLNLMTPLFSFEDLFHLVQLKIDKMHMKLTLER